MSLLSDPEHWGNVSPTASVMGICRYGDLEEVRERFVARLRAAIQPIAQSLDIGVQLVSPSSNYWISKSDSCQCPSGDVASSAGVSGCRPGRAVWRANILCNKIDLGDVTICHKSADQFVPPIVDCVVRATSDRVGMEEEEQALLEELSSCWESLEAVYEIGSDVGASQDPRDLLGRIVRRAVSISPDLAGALWIQQDGGLRSVVSENVTGLLHKSVNEGVIGKALADSASPTAINGRDLVARADGPNPELERAVCVAVVPMATRQGVLGALEVWGETDGTRLDSRHVRLLQTLAHQAAMVIENDRLHRASMDSMRLRQEIEIGSKIQQALLVAQPPKRVRNLKIAALTIPSQSIDGDFYDFIEHDDHCVDVLVGDVMGKGIPAALVGAATKNQFLRAMGQWSGAFERDRIPSPEEIVGMVHRKVTRQLIELESFATACYARFNTLVGTLEIVDCGHTRTIRYWQRAGMCGMLQGDNMPLGFSEGEIYRQFSVPLEKGDVFLFYSDGVTEARNREGELFGEERLSHCVKKYGRLDPEQLIRQIQKEIADFSNSAELADDLTCVAVKVCEDEGTPALIDELDTLSDLADLADVRAFVRKVCQSLPDQEIDDSTVSALELAINEAAANIIKHAYRGRIDGLIQIEARSKDDWLTFELNHFGEPFNPKVINAAAFDGSREGGFGLFIIDQIVDEVGYSSDEHGRHTVRLRKRLGRKGARPDTR